MLREDEKTRIRLEESLRDEIRRELNSRNPTTTKAKLWQLLNSAFFLWFLSTVVIGIVSFFYAKWDQQRVIEQRAYEERLRIERENRTLAKRIDAEISNRLFYFVLSTNYGVVYAKPDSRIVSETIQDVVKGVIALERPSVAEYPTNVFPEYAERSLRSLLWELSSIVSDSEKQAVTRAYEVSRKLQLLYLLAKRRQVKTDTSTQTQGGSEVKSSSFWSSIVDAAKRLVDEAHRVTSELTYGEVREALNLERWGKPFGKTEQ